MSGQPVHNIGESRRCATEEARSLLVAEGAWVHPGVTYVSTPDGEISMVTSVPIAENTVLAFIPKRLCCKGSKIDIIMDIAKCTFDLAGSEDVSIAVKKYLKTCPTSLSHLPLNCLRESTSEGIIAEWNHYDAEFAAMMQSIYVSEMDAYREYMKLHPECPVNEGQYLHALMLYNTRAWSDFGLVPLIDMAQHQNQAKCTLFSAIYNNAHPHLINAMSAFSTSHPELDIGIQDPMLLNEKPLIAGEEICISYGNKTMINMLANYGFVDRVRPQILLTVGTARCTEAAKTHIEKNNLLRNYVITDTPAGLHPEFFRVSRMTFDKNFDPAKDYRHGLNDLNIEKEVIADVLSSFTKYHDALTIKCERLTEKIGSILLSESRGSEMKPHEQFYQPLKKIAEIELEIILRNIDYLKNYWMSIVFPIVTK